MIDFTPIFLSDSSSGIEMEGFWIMFSSNPPFHNPNIALKELPNTGWDNRNSLLPTNTLFYDERVEISFFPNDIYTLDATTVSISQIRSWYLIYRLPMFRDSVGNYRIACSMSTADYPLEDYWYIQNVLKANLSDKVKLYSTRISETNYPENTLRRRFIEESDNSSSIDKQLLKRDSDLLSDGLLNRNKCVIIY